MLRRQPMKRTGGTLKHGGPIKRKPKSPEKVEEKKLQSEKDNAFYQQIWNSRSHSCEVHDGYKFLGYAIKKLFFDHLLEKSIYPEFRYEPKNIALVCGDCHTLKTNGFPTKEHKKRIDQAREELLGSGDE